MQQDSQSSAYLAGLQKLIRLWKANAHLPARLIFAETWKIILKDEATFAGPFRRNRYNIPWANFVFVDVARNLKAARPDFSPEIKLHLPREVQGAFRSSIFVTLHSDLEYSIVSTLQGTGARCTIIWAAKVDAPPAIYDHTSGVGKIARDQNCFLVARKELLEGCNLIVPADYTVYVPKTKSSLRKVGTGVFDFAKKCRFKLFYILPVVGREGEINMFAELADSEMSAADCANKFLEFCACHSPNKIELMADSWSSDIKGNVRPVV